MNSTKKIVTFSKIEDFEIFNKIDLKKLTQLGENLKDNKNVRFLENYLYEILNKKMIERFYSFKELIDCNILINYENQILLCNFCFLGYDKEYDSLVFINMSYPNKQSSVGMNMFLYLELKREDGNG